MVIDYNLHLSQRNCISDLTWCRVCILGGARRTSDASRLAAEARSDKGEKSIYEGPDSKSTVRAHYLNVSFFAVGKLVKSPRKQGCMGVVSVRLTMVGNRLVISCGCDGAYWRPRIFKPERTGGLMGTT